VKRQKGFISYASKEDEQNLSCPHLGAELSFLKCAFHHGIARCSGLPIIIQSTALKLNKSMAIGDAIHVVVCHTIVA
jgi:hypothetical protein